MVGMKVGAPGSGVGRGVGRAEGAAKQFTSRGAMPTGFCGDHCQPDEPVEDITRGGVTLRSATVASIPVGPEVVPILVKGNTRELHPVRKRKLKYPPG